MILITEGQNNTVNATCSRNKQLTGSPTYLWTMRHKLSNRSWGGFIPFRIIPSVSYTPGYDLFTIKVDPTQPEVYTSTTSADTVNLHLYEGEYFVKIYEQVSTTNLNPSLSYDVVYEGIAKVLTTGDTYQQISYTGNSNVFKIYNG
jgi:hypothetical protein